MKETKRGKGRESVAAAAATAKYIHTYTDTLAHTNTREHTNTNARIHRINSFLAPNLNLLQNFY